MSRPLVSVICICHNHALYVNEAIQSVVAQSYPHIELIVVNDPGTDNSEVVIKEILSRMPACKSIFFEQNMGNCKAFNAALQIASGKYVIDLAADDLLLPHRIEKEINFFEQLPHNCGAVFSNLRFVDKEGIITGTHYKTDAEGRSLKKIPSGDIYRHILGYYLISPPAVIFKKSVLELLYGYDEALSYEDFDIHLRIARDHEIHYLDEILTHKRVLQNSHGAHYYFKKNPHALSTLCIMSKALKMNRNTGEMQAWKQRLLYEMKIAFVTENFPVAIGYHALYRKSGMRFSLYEFLLYAAAWTKLPVYPLYRWLSRRMN